MAKHVTVGDWDGDEKMKPSSHLYTTIPPNVVLVGVPGDPLDKLMGVPQLTTIKAKIKGLYYSYSV